jgi:uncharacterized protein YndB with AHSA1/START domain
MARNTAYMPVPTTAVWSVLEDPYAYPKWVVGADRTLEADAQWPAPGSRFKVHLGLGIKDYTKVREVDPGRRIVLDAAAGYLGPARVEIELEPSNGGTQVTMIEDPAGKVAPMRFFPPVHLAIRLRNVESLRRLQRLAERRG